LFERNIQHLAFHLGSNGWENFGKRHGVATEDGIAREIVIAALVDLAAAVLPILPRPSIPVRRGCAVFTWSASLVTS
jgi:hypothetical protein